jgi:protocatechuate 3,4-dioxygenase beta subunit
VPDTGGWWRPPHVHFSVCGRVWLSRLVTQMFFPASRSTKPTRSSTRSATRRARALHRALVPSKGTRLIFEHQLVVRGRKGTPFCREALVPTGEMTLGPFFPRSSPGCERPRRELSASVIEITGRVTELDGKPLDNVILEIWQADAAGRFDDPAFFGWGRAAPTPTASIASARSGRARPRGARRT